MNWLRKNNNINRLEISAAGDRAEVLKTLQDMLNSLNDLVETGTDLLVDMNKISLDTRVIGMFNDKVLKILAYRLPDEMEAIIEEVQHLEM
jgi:archaellum component FlaC